MTNGIALVLAALILAAVAANAWFGWDAHIFVARKLGEATEWLAFWR